ncbi:hypothetical protein E2C01_049335 [Portunus trituberculatus]|uniref:Uncharacterized protein n=1 Tax=Portunus trituberculatus TaxID=210409 RepID=A0A5B7G5A8_PORTR|nr:hypothetical protein [Portunus trituberculatus]
MLRCDWRKRAEGEDGGGDGEEGVMGMSPPNASLTPISFVSCHCFSLFYFSGAFFRFSIGRHSALLVWPICSPSLLAAPRPNRFDAGNSYAALGICKSAGDKEEKYSYSLTKPAGERAGGETKKGDVLLAILAAAARCGEGVCVWPLGGALTRLLTHRQLIFQLRDELLVASVCESPAPAASPAMPAPSFVPRPTLRSPLSCRPRLLQDVVVVLVVVVVVVWVMGFACGRRCSGVVGSLSGVVRRVISAMGRWGVVEVVCVVLW